MLDGSPQEAAGTSTPPATASLAAGGVPSQFIAKLYREAPLLGLVEPAEVIEATRNVRMHRPKRLLADVERADIERLGLGIRAWAWLGLVEPARLVATGT
jgi:hypothetical protein